MLKRIRNKKPAISTDKLEKDWKQNLKFMDNISAYPEDWYLKEARSNPNLSDRNKGNANEEQEEKDYDEEEFDEENNTQ